MPSTGMPRAVQPPAHDVCCFCHQPGDPGVPGQLAVLLTARQAPPRPTLAHHEACAGYSSAIAWGRKIGQKRVPYGAGEIPAKLVHSEWTRGARLACTICGQPGATVCCKGIRECGVCWHFPCARQAAQDRRGVVFSATQREVACSEHAASIVSRVREPAGLWLQGCGGWDDQDEQVASSWWAAKDAINDLFESDSEPQGGAGQQQQQPGAAPARGAAAAPASPTGAPAPAPASCGAQEPEVIDLLDDEVAPNSQLQQAQPEQAQQQAHAAEPPQHQQSPEPPAAAARMRRIARKQVQPAVQKRRQPRPAAHLDEALPLSRGGAAAAGGSLQRAAEAPESEEEADEKAWRLPGHQWVLRGDIGGPPPHRPRDLLVLSTVIPYRRQFRAVTRAYQQRMQESPSQFPPVVAAAAEFLPTESERLKAGKAIEDYIKRHAGLKGNAKLSSPDQLPEVLPMATCGERFPIPPDDPRTALAADAGALGWRNHKPQEEGKHKGRRRRAAARVPRFTVLGSYQSLQLKNEHYEEMTVDKELAEAMGLPTNQMVLCLDAYGADADLGTNIFLERSSGALMAAAGPLFDICLHKKIKTFTHSAFGFGNETALINDVALDPIADVKAGREDLRRFQSPNCAFLECLVFGWPFMFVLTIRDVEPEKEFLLEYGQGYWRHIRKERERSRLSEEERQAQAQRMQEAQARLLELQRQQEQHLAAAASGLPTSGDHEAGITQASGVAASHVGAPAAAAPAEPAAVVAAEAEQQKQEQRQVQQQEQQQDKKQDDAAALAAAAAAAPAASMQGSPTSPALAAGEAVATSPGPKPPRKPLASPASAAGGSHRSGSKRGRSRSRSRSRGRSRSRDKAKRPRSRDRKGSPCKPRSRSRERRRSRTRSGSRKRHRHERSPRRPSDSGRGREEERRSGKSGRSRSRSGGRPRSRERREAPSSRQQRSEPVVPPGFAMARQPLGPPGFAVARQPSAAQEQRARHGAPPPQQHQQQQRSSAAEPVRQASAKGAVSLQERHQQPPYQAQPQPKQQPSYQPPPQASPRQQPPYQPPPQQQQQQQQRPYQPPPRAQQQQQQRPYQPPPQAQQQGPARLPAAPAHGRWEDSPPRQPMPPPEDGSGTPDVDSDSLDPEPPRDGSGTPDVMDDWQVPAEVLEPWQPVVGPPPPGWQPPQRQPQQQQQQAWQQQQQPAWQQPQAAAQPAAAEEERERSVTPDVDEDDLEAGLPLAAGPGPGWAPPAYQQPPQQHQAWQQQWQQPAPQQQWQQPPPQPRPPQQQAPQQHQPQQLPRHHAAAQQQQQPIPQLWRQDNMARQQPARQQYQWPARPGQMEQRQQSQQPRPQPHQQQAPRGSMGTSSQPGFSSRPQSRASQGSGGAAAAGRMPPERQQQQQRPAAPSSGAGRMTAAARHVLPEPVPVGQSGHMLDRHAATARGLPRKDSRTTK